MQVSIKAKVRKMPFSWLLSFPTENVNHDVYPYSTTVCWMYGEGWWGADNLPF